MGAMSTASIFFMLPLFAVLLGKQPFVMNR